MIEIELKLMGTLKSRFREGRLELPDDATIADALEGLEVPPKAVQTCTVNGKFVHDRSHPLADGDELTLLPPVGGG